MAVKATGERSPLSQARPNQPDDTPQAAEARSASDGWFDSLLEAGWLTAVVVTPLLFSSYSPRAFGSAKVIVVQCLALFMLLVWLTRQVAQRLGPRNAAPPAASPAAARAAWLTSPLVLPVLYLALVYAVTSLTSIAPRLSLWGSYQRLEGAYTALSYLVIFLLTAAYLRRRPQADRLVTVILLGSWPVCLFGLAQQFGLDPIPWTGEERVGIFSTLGHPLYLAGYLIMVMPLTFQRLGEAVARLRQGSSRALQTWLLVASLAALLALQLVCLLLTQSRGPLIGLLVAAFVLFLVWVYARGQRGLVFTLLALGFELVLLVVLLNLPNTPLPAVRRRVAQLPVLSRITRMVETTGSSGFRLLLWNSTAQMMGANPTRLLLGYGPETFASVVLPYYSPSDIGSTTESLPERAHNITLDVLSTTGLLGLLAQTVLFCGVLLAGLAGLGLLAVPRAGPAALACLVLGMLAGGLGPRLVTGGWGLSGLGLSLGLVAGCLLFLVARITLWRETGPTPRPALPFTAALLAAVVAHLVDISFSFRLPTTQLLFWLFAALLARRAWDADEAPALAAQPGPALGGLLALALTALAYDFSDPYHLNAAQRAWVGPLLMALTFVLAGSTALWANARRDGPRRLFFDATAAPWLVAAYLVGLYWLTRLPLEWLTRDAQALLVHFVVWLVILVAAVAWGCSGAGPLRRPTLSRPQAGVVGVGALALLVVVGGSLRPLQADLYATQGRLAAQTGQWDQSVTLFQRAIGLAPTESYFYQQASKTLLDRALATANPAEKETWFQRGAALLDQARALLPYGVDPVYNTAQYYVTWAQAATTQKQRLERADTALAFCEQSKRMIGTIADVHLTCGLAQEAKGAYPQALAEYQRALELNQKLGQAYIQMGNVYRQQGNIPQAILAYQTALSRQPKLIEARRRLGSLYLEQGDLNAALGEARAAVDTQPSDFEARRDLIAVYVKLGQKKEALREALAAQDIAPADQRPALTKLIEELKAQP